jgi:Cu+-exporting ATPase
MGLKTILLTGDSKTIAQAVGKGLGVDEISAELLPEQKLQRVKELLAQGKKVVMVLIGSDLTKLVETVRIARHCHRTIMQNFVGTLVVDSIGVGLAAFGFLNPLLAAFIHVSSEMTFILNSARLLSPVSSANKLVRGLLSHSPTATS